MKIFLGILFFLIGSAAALFFFFTRSHLVPEPIITIAKKESNFEPSKFSLEEAPSDSLKGQITLLEGSVWHQSRTATEPAQLLQPITLQQGEVIIASNSGKLSANFNPALSLSLSPQTELEIIQTLPLNLVFNQKRGAVTYQVSGTSPVTIRSLNLIVDVETGLIEVDTNDQTGEINLSLQSGRAKVGYNSPEFESKVWDLEPGDTFSYDSNERKGYFNAP